LEFEQLLALLCFSHWIDTPIYESGREWGAQEGGGGHIKQLEMEAHCSKNRNIKKNIKAQGMQSSKKKQKEQIEADTERTWSTKGFMSLIENRNIHRNYVCMYIYIYISPGEIPRQKGMAHMQNKLTKSCALCCCPGESQGRGQRSAKRGRHKTDRFMRAKRETISTLFAEEPVYLYLIFKLNQLCQYH